MRKKKFFFLGIFASFLTFSVEFGATLLSTRWRFIYYYKTVPNHITFSVNNLNFSLNFKCSQIGTVTKNGLILKDPTMSRIVKLIGSIVFHFFNYSCYFLLLVVTLTQLVKCKKFEISFIVNTLLSWPVIDE